MGHAHLPGAEAPSVVDRQYTLSQELDFGLELADIAEQIVVNQFRREGFAFENKYDGSPVTAIDRQVEHAIRDLVAIRRPGYGVLGEEGGIGSIESGNAGAPGRPPRWIVDPIDGTRKFVRGIPIFATLLALEVEGEIVVAVASAPMMANTGRRWWAARGLGAFSDGRLLQVSKIDRLEDAHVLHGSIEGWFKHDLGLPLLDLSRRCWGTVGFGDFWIHLLVAEGAADAAAEPDAAVWDVAALKLIVEEAGGRFTDFNGRSTPAGGSGLSTNGLVHEEILALLRR